MESSVRPLPRSFCVKSLRDFVGSLPDELLLCPIRALKVYLPRTSSLPSRPWSLFVPSRPLSKNALSFFIHSVISSASSSSSSSVSGASAPSSLRASCSASSFRAHGVHGVAASWAYSRNAPLSALLEAATWSSSAVFTSFYLKDVQFVSDSGFSLGPVVAAGSVV